MKAIAATLLVGIIGFGIVGCGSSPDPRPTVTVTAPATPSPVELAPAEPTPIPSSTQSTVLSRTQLEELYLRVIKQEYPQYNDSRKDLLDLADTTCQKFREGVSARDIIGTIDPNASNSGYLSFIVGAATGVFCPEYAGEFRKLAGQ